MIPVKVSGLSLSNMGFVVLLRGTADERALPVFIGAAEAQAIAIQIDNVKVPRPLTHDLLKNVLTCVEWSVKRVVVNDLIDNTFYAKIIIEHDGIQTDIDSRPSDAIALALRCNTPIFVLEKVMDQAGLKVPENEQLAQEPSAGTDEPEPAVPPISKLDYLKIQIDRAIKEERYEDAARFRDEMKHAGKGQKNN